MKNPQRGTIRWIWRHSGPYRRGVFAITALYVLASVNAVLFPVLFRGLIDSVTAGALDSFLLFGGIYGGLYLLATLVEFLYTHINHRVCFRMEAHMKGQLYQGLLHTEYAALQAHSLGELSSHLNNDVNIVTSGLANLIPSLIALLIRVTGAALVLLLWDPLFFLIFAAAMLVGAVGMVFLRKPMQDLHRQIRQEYDMVEAVQQDTLRNTLMVRSFLGFGSAMHTWSDRVDRLRKASYRQNRASNLLHTGYMLFIDLGYLGCLAWYGMGIIAGTVSYGMLAGALQLVSQLQSPFGEVNKLFSSYCAMQSSALRLMALDELPKEPPQEPMEDCDMERLEVRDLSFTYGDGLVLDGVDLTVRRGEFIAFVGMSGEGKSTLLKLLLALYRPTGGSVALVDSHGERRPLSAATRGLFAYVPQGNSIMAGTLYQVVSFAYHRTDFTPQEQAKIRQACTVACADEFIQALPQGYDTRVGETGTGLSEGQLQRLSIARAIYYRAPVLLLDEATSALDGETEGRVLDNIRRLQDRTVLIITHNHRALTICDRQMRLKGGRLYEEQPSAEG